MNANPQQTTKQLLWKTRAWYKFLLPFIAAVISAAAVCAYGAPAVQAAPTTTVDGVIYAIDESAGEAYATSAVKAQVPADLVIPASIDYEGTTYNIVSLNTMFLSDCTSLKSVTVSDGVNRLGDSPFINCSSLEKVVLPDSVTSIGNSCFATCSALTDVTLPKGLTSLGTSCFQSCSSLESVEIPAGVTTLGQGCFANCSSLKSVEIPATATAVEATCFTSCTSLESIEIPAGVASLGDMCFYNCSALRSVEIPVGVASLGTICFSECSSLAEVIFAGDAVESCGENAFFGGPDSRKYIFKKARPSALAEALADENCWYYVTFLGADGSVIDEQLLVTGATAAEPSADKVPQKDAEGRIFAGWSSDAWSKPVADASVAVTAVYRERPTPAEIWTHLAGNTAIGTMKQIVNEGWDASEFAIVATNKSYHDALAASGLAGLLDCPILMTAPDKLTDVTAKLITAKKVKNVVVVGGNSAVSDAVFNQIKELDGVSSVERVAGNTAIGTANKIYDYGTTLAASGAISGGWGKDAVVATTSSYHDAASIAPYAYAQHAPVFFVDGTLSDGTAKRVVDASAFDRTLVIGGTAAVSDDVKAKLANPTRLGGGTAYGTCKKVAEFSLANGMTAQHMGVATGRSYQDAVVGAALCGKNNSILVLADDGNSNNVGSVVAAHKDALAENCYVFGGEQAVSSAVYSAILVASE